MVNIEAINKWILEVKRAKTLDYEDLNYCILALGIKALIPIESIDAYNITNLQKLEVVTGLSYTTLKELEKEFYYLQKESFSPLSVLKEYTIELLEQLKINKGDLWT